MLGEYCVECSGNEDRAWVAVNGSDGVIAAVGCIGQGCICRGVQCVGDSRSV